MGGRMTMGRAELLSALAVVFAVVAGLVTAFAGSQGSQTAAGLPVFAIAVALAFIVQWVAFVPAYLGQSERFFDLTGSLTYIGVTVVAVALTSVRDERTALLTIIVVIWAARLGTFLFRRIRRAGKDDRFDELKPSPLRFLAVWTVQGLWITLTLAAALAAVTSAQREPLGAVGLVGLLIWCAGFGIEAVADWQKSRFRSVAANRDRYIDTGLWSWSRHPNYFGEIVLWLGVAVIAVPVLSGPQLLTLISPVFVALLLTRVSGIPLLERKADARWGGQADYEAYKARTPALVPRPPRSA